jgi:AcrR family transcriptional regulator
VTVDADKAIGPRSSKGERTRGKLLLAAKEIFEERGFMDARISDIAERAKLSYGSFYHYFQSKEEIFREVAAVHERRLGAAVVAETEDLTSASHGDLLIRRWEAASRRYLSEYRREARLMRVIEEVSRYDAVLNETRLYRHARVAERLAEVIGQLQRDGFADPQVDPRIGSEAITAMVTRFAEAWLVEGRIDIGFEDGVTQLNRLCLNVIRPASTRED